MRLLLAEAVQRGWVTGVVADLYNKGVKLHMEQFAAFDAKSAVTVAAADAYLTANPYTAAQALEQINTQYWISSFLNGTEAWANFRRSGFPALSQNPFPGKSIKGTFKGNKIAPFSAKSGAKESTFVPFSAISLIDK